MNRLQGLLLTLFTVSFFISCSEDAVVTPSTSTPISVTLESNLSSPKSDESFTLTAKTDAKDPSFEWKEGGKADETSGWDGGGSTKTFKKTSGEHIFHVRVTSGTQTATATITVTVVAGSVSVDLQSNKPSYMINETITLTASTTASNPTYQWKEGSGAWESGTATKTYTKTTAGDFEFTVKMTSGGSSAEKKVAVRVNPSGTISVDLKSNKSAYMINEPITLTASTTASSPKYEWKEGSGAWESGTATKTYTKTTAGNFEFTVKMTSGTSSSLEKTIKISVTSGSEENLKGDGIPDPRYHKHSNIIASLFWVGEGASDANHNISNKPSAWRGDWSTQYGLEDWQYMSRDSKGFPLDPRYKYIENPYYIALPYNDMGALISDENGKIVKDLNITVDTTEYGRKKSSLSASYWGKDKKWPNYNESLIKNRWVKVTYNGKHCYAQVEDAGPFFYNDTAYVFGTARPINEAYKTTPNSFQNLGAGIDLSPAVMQFLTGNAGLGQTVVDWQFIDEANVPSGPWARVITKSQMGGWK